jgi:hypothetical protein
MFKIKQRRCKLMLELSSQEVVCPVCKKSFFPETRAGRKVLCGDNVEEPPVGRIRNFLQKIGDVSAKCGINEHVSCHILNRMRGN